MAVKTKKYKKNRPSAFWKVEIVERRKKLRLSRILLGTKF